MCQRKNDHRKQHLMFLCFRESTGMLVSPSHPFSNSFATLTPTPTTTTTTPFIAYPSAPRHVYSQQAADPALTVRLQFSKYPSRLVRD
jgi:hypothetical protein